MCFMSLVIKRDGIQILNTEIPLLNLPWYLVSTEISIVENELQMVNLFLKLQRYLKVFALRIVKKLKKELEKLALQMDFSFTDRQELERLD